MKRIINYPPEVVKIAKILAEKGHKAYAVGGCVRDSVMGRVPSDWDMTTDATPDQMLEIFKEAGLHTIPTGIKHGTVTVMIDKKPYECTTFRIDGSYTDSRRPDTVEFATEISKDLCRRDFTVNAMAANPLFSERVLTYNSLVGTDCENTTTCNGFVGTDYGNSPDCNSIVGVNCEASSICNGLVGENCEIIDIYGGMDDIERGVIRCVGQAERRFSEDALRILRAIRFATVLDFKIEKTTLDAAVVLSGKLAEISAERKAVELEKILLSEHADRGVKLLLETGIAKYIHPKIAPPAVPLSTLPSNFAVRFAALLLGEGKPDVSNMKFSNEIKDNVCLLADNIVFDRCKAFFGSDLCANARMAISKYGNLAQSAAILRGEDRFAEIIDREAATEPAVKIADLDINGDQLMDTGIEQKKLGALFSRLLISVIKDPALNRRERLISLARSIADEEF